MKDFFKFTLATVTGIILSSIVLFFIGIMVIFGIVSSSDTETVVKKNSVMMLDLNGILVERTQESLENVLSMLTGDNSNVYGLDDILASIKKAKENENIKGIYIQASALGSPYASLQAIRNALTDFKESGKFIVAYSDGYTQGLYYLSSVADKVILNPKGMIEWRGIASAPIFYKDLLQKVGIEMQIFKVGTYKSAVEPFIATEMSPPRDRHLSCNQHPRPCGKGSGQPHAQHLSAGSGPGCPPLGSQSRPDAGAFQRGGGQGAGHHHRQKLEHCTELPRPDQRRLCVHRVPDRLGG